jgi:hypothetical protein
MIHADTSITDRGIRALAELYSAESEAIHPRACNCERCEWLLGIALKIAFKAYYAKQPRYKVVDLMEPQTEGEV